MKLQDSVSGYKLSHDDAATTAPALGLSAAPAARSVARPGVKAVTSAKGAKARGARNKAAGTALVVAGAGAAAAEAADDTEAAEPKLLRPSATAAGNGSDNGDWSAF